MYGLNASPKNVIWTFYTFTMFTIRLHKTEGPLPAEWHFTFFVFALVYCMCLSAVPTSLATIDFQNSPHPFALMGFGLKFTVYRIYFEFDEWPANWKQAYLPITIYKYNVTYSCSQQLIRIYSVDVIPVLEEFWLIALSYQTSYLSLKDNSFSSR